VTEAEILDALDIAHGEIKKICEAQRELQKKAGKEKQEVEVPQVDEKLLGEIKDKFGDALNAATQVEDKLERQDATKKVEEEVFEAFGSEGDDTDAVERRQAVQLAFDKLEKDTIRTRIAVDKKRPDGRKADEIRDISIEVAVAPRTHGSALFTRGQTQAFSVAALGTTREEMRLDTLGLETSKYYFHHYNFPPFSVGEAGFMRGPKRRDIGHGALAERALVPMVPSVEDFPYTIRVVSDIFESNGSSSMASVCGSSLSLMDAGVPIKRPVAGVAMGLITGPEGKWQVLTDIQGLEDNLGDMDFKVAGTSEGVTGLQMDIKTTGITYDIMRQAFAQAREGRLFILGKMNEVIDQPREELSPFAPRIITLQINPEKIGALIGPGGKTIRGITESTGAQIDVEDDGRVFVSTADGEAAKAAVAMVEALTREIKVGDVFLGKVVRIMPFGAFVNLDPGKDGMVHVSELDTSRVENVEDVVKMGDEINVMVIGVEPGTGKVSLSRRALLTGESPEDRIAAGAGRGVRGGNGGNGGGGRGGFGGRGPGDRGGDRGGPGGDRNRPRRREQ
jgi:polyribonucleotide nucleotidyltransferase